MIIMNTKETCIARVYGKYLTSKSKAFFLSLDDLSIEMCPSNIVEGHIMFSIKIIGEKEFKITDINKLI